MTCVPVLGDEQFQFLWRVIFFLEISAQTGSNWFLLILQTANLSTEKESYCYIFQGWWVENLFGLKHTEADMCLKWWLQKFDLRILKSVTCLGFSKTEEFYQGWNFGCFWWKFLNNNPMCITFINVFVSHQFFKTMKKLCKRAMT